MYCKTNRQGIQEFRTINIMSISLPTSKAEKKARYRMLIRQGSLTIQQANKEYRRYLTWLK